MNSVFDNAYYHVIMEISGFVKQGIIMQNYALNRLIFPLVIIII